MTTLAFHFYFFFLNDPAPPEIYPLPLHDALPICAGAELAQFVGRADEQHVHRVHAPAHGVGRKKLHRSEEHTSELQSPCNLVCRLLLEKKNTHTRTTRALSFRISYAVLTSAY